MYRWPPADRSFKTDFEEFYGRRHTLINLADAVQKRGSRCGLKGVHVFIRSWIGPYEIWHTWWDAGGQLRLCIVPCSPGSGQPIRKCADPESHAIRGADGTVVLYACPASNDECHRYIYPPGTEEDIGADWLILASSWPRFVKRALGVKAR